MNAITADAAGNIFLGGSVSNGVLENEVLNYGVNQFVIAKYSSFGNLTWVQGINIASKEVIAGEALNKEGNLAITGFVAGNFTIPALHLSGSSNASINPLAIPYPYDILNTILHDTVGSIIDTTSNLEPNRISGKVFMDLNSNCIQDSNEEGIANLIIKAEPVIIF